MNITEHITALAEHIFDHDGFNATGMGRLIRESGLSSRTVYKHVASKNALMKQVLTNRQERFFSQTDFSSIDALFDSLSEWSRAEGARGCLFFRVQAETGGHIPEISEAVSQYHQRLHKSMLALVTREAGKSDRLLVNQLLVLFEGATITVTYRGRDAIVAAKASAKQLIAARRETGE